MIYTTATQPETIFALQARALRLCCAAGPIVFVLGLLCASLIFLSPRGYITTPDPISIALPYPWMVLSLLLFLNMILRAIDSVQEANIESLGRNLIISLQQLLSIVSVIFDFIYIEGITFLLGAALCAVFQGNYKSPSVVYGVQYGWPSFYWTKIILISNVYVFFLLILEWPLLVVENVRSYLKVFFFIATIFLGLMFYCYKSNNMLLNDFVKNVDSNDLIIIILIIYIFVIEVLNKLWMSVVQWGWQWPYRPLWQWPWNWDEDTAIGRWIVSFSGTAGKTLVWLPMDSASLVWGNWCRTFAVVLIPWVFYLIIMMIMQYASLNFFPLNKSMENMANILILGFFIPWMMAVLLVQVYDLNLRNPDTKANTSGDAAE